MSNNLGDRLKRGVADPQNPVLANGYTVSFGPADLPKQACEMYHAAIMGPAGSTFQVWKNTHFYDNVVRGDLNSWDPAQPMLIEPGDTIYYYWSLGAPSAVPVVSIYLRRASLI